MNYRYFNKELDELFIEWEKESEARGDGPLTRDGLMRLPNDLDVNKLWGEATRRIMFLLKDQPNSPGDDVRNWLIAGKNAQNNRTLNSRKKFFLPRLAHLLYAFTYDETNYKKISYEDAVKCFNEKPYAFVETKKCSGGGRVDNKVVTTYIEKYEPYLIKD